MRRRSYLLLLLCFLLLIPRLPARAQTGSDLLELQVDIAYDGYFRDEQWFPLYVTATNNGDPFDGRIVVRPETSRGVQGTFSLPIDLPTNSVKSDTLYLAAQGLATQIRVELIDNVDELVLASTTVPVQSIQPTDQLYVVVTASAVGSVDLTGARAEGMIAVQANWEIDTLPDNPAALTAVNMMLFSDVDTGGLTLAQAAALEAWVAGGGHLVVTGGANWAQTAAGLADILPFTPTDSVTIDDITPLAAFVGETTALDERTPLAVGEVLDGARILAETADGEPLLIRRTLGEGTVDYLTVDPNTAPLRGWRSLNRLWYTLATTADPVPAWSYNFTVWDNAINAAEILPGINVLPSVLPICGFLALYIALIGPVNYIVLNRINRREWAWVSIPVLIAIFSVLAFVVGGQLRGNTPNIGRITMVRSWQDTDIAHTTEIVGLLSPQRTQYTMSAEPGVLMRSLPRSALTGGGSLLASNFQSSIELQQTDRFRAAEFPVDASFIAGFASYGTTPRPNITGSATILYPPSERRVQQVRGSVRNNTDFTLTHGLILARGAVYYLDDLPPGEVAAFEMQLDGEEPPAPAPIGYDAGQFSLGLGYGNNVFDQTVRDVMGSADYNYNTYNTTYYDDRGLETIERQELRRRQLFLSGLIREQYVSTARANDVYFVGWGTEPLTTLELENTGYNAYPSTVYVVRLSTQVEQPPNKRVRVSGDQFTWSVYEREGVGATAPVNLSLGEGGRVAFRFTPLPGAQLDRVQQIWVLVQRNSGGRTTIPVSIWNWETGVWDTQIIANNQLELDDTAPYLGHDNSVIVRLQGDDIAFTNLRFLWVEQVGTFAG